MKLLFEEYQKVAPMVSRFGVKCEDPGANCQLVQQVVRSDRLQGQELLTAGTQDWDNWYPGLG